MTTIAAQAKNIRRLLQDDPLTDTLDGAIATGATTTMGVADISKHAVGQWWEFDDDTGDIALETAVNPSTAVVTIRRSHLGSTAAAHADACVIAKSPRFKYDLISQAITSVLESDLDGENIFDLQEHQITSSATTNYYNAPSTSCERFMDVYQKTTGMVSPRRANLWFSPTPTNADTGLYSNGKYFVIQGQYGTAGTDVYYVTCRHPLAIGTLTASQERIVQFLACAYLLEWTEPRRLAGPNNQGDTTVKPGDGNRTAAYWRGLAEEQMSKEQQRLRNLFPPQRRFVRQ
jgi:hypothetical protein